MMNEVIIKQKLHFNFQVNNFKANKFGLVTSKSIDNNSQQLILLVIHH